ncbi:hypothetical protein SAMN05216428_102443 [Nitrosospira sp. Nsp11]|uniref:hypothetical protein n=1 Tax=Nitrosospira sp. Nsp11 TaxID=1855338 RepID=UPI0009125116|nr:hypothetical protein [Nitrosospira sp. Nsp11]SHL45065.1 hypothetical protein SAMN05216428_102443 [Nitrosospira sp. Nsp11]
MDPMSLLAAVGPGLGQGLGQGLAGLAGGAGGPAVSRADGAKIEPVFDNSGWNVNFSSGSITSDRQQLPALGGMEWTTAAMWIAGGLVVWKIIQKKAK